MSLCTSEDSDSSSGSKYFDSKRSSRPKRKNILRPPHRRAHLLCHNSLESVGTPLSSRRGSRDSSRNDDKLQRFHSPKLIDDVYKAKNNNEEEELLQMVLKVGSG